MALGIDIYRYQTVTDWQAVKRSGVSFVYVKGTDGGGLAPVHADLQVRGAQSVKLPVGLYHYAQFSPSPETQADVLTAEVRRLDATGMPPALDLEDPFGGNSTARAFAQRFLNRLRANGFATVMLYGNTSMLSGIGADTLGVPGLRIWAANYGVNDGTRHALSYRGRVDIHQYTSAGRLPGITGSVDLNESLTSLGEDDMTPEQANQLQFLYDAFTKGGPTTHGEALVNTLWEIKGLGIRTETKVDAGFKDLSNDEANIIAAVRAGGLDPAAFAALVGPYIKAGATAEEVQAAATEGVRQAFARAGSQEGNPV